MLTKYRAVLFLLSFTAVTGSAARPATRIAPDAQRQDTPRVPPMFICEGPIETMPAFRGNLRAYCDSNLRYPDSAKSAGQEGRVVLGFTVDTTGLLRELKIVRSCGWPVLDLEAMRVLEPMCSRPLWTPGSVNGVLVPVAFTLPLTFRMD